MRRSGVARFVAFPGLSWLGVFAVLALPAAGGVARAGVVYFEVAEKPGVVTHHDSYVLPLTEPQDIRHARDLIRLGPDEAGSTIVFAHIAAGADGINRNLAAPGQPEWSWHVTQFDGFNDFGIEVLDGWPTFVEQDVQGWLENTNSRIGFWSYTVTRELVGYPDAVPANPVPLPPALPAAAGMLVAAAGVRWYVRRGTRAA